MSGMLSIVGTPIGNLDDLSPRAARTLAAADIIACEDTRVARTLLTRVDGSRARLVSCHARNEKARVPELVRAIAAGSHVAFTTDAGMPGLSDPGQHLVAACAAAGLRMEVIPGPSASISALILSGLPTARFVFEGFLPRSGTARRRRLAALATEQRTIVIFESPHRIAAMLADAAAVLGARRAALARELTKMHEEVRRATLPELLAGLDDHPARGEITIVIEGAEPPVAERDDDALIAAVETLTDDGMTRRDAIARVAADSGTPKNDLYRLILSSDAEAD